MDNLLKVGLLSLGAVLGVNARFWLSHWINGRSESLFPWATFLINVSGSFLIGLVMVILSCWLAHQHYRIFLVVGLIGGYTTYSAFAFESLMLWQRGERGLSLGYMAATLGCGLLAVALGAALGRQIAGPLPLPLPLPTQVPAATQDHPSDSDD